MPSPAAYTEDQLAAWMIGIMGTTLTAGGSVAALLGWDAYHPTVREAVNATLDSLGVATIADATDIPKLKAIARRELWRAVANATVGLHNYSAEGQSFNLKDVHDHAIAAERRAMFEARRQGYVRSAYAWSQRRTDNPYPYIPDDERTIG